MVKPNALWRRVQPGRVQQLHGGPRIRAGQLRDGGIVEISWSRQIGPVRHLADAEPQPVNG